MGEKLVRQWLSVAMGEQPWTPLATAMGNIIAERDKLRGEVDALRVANERLFRMMDRDAEACRNDGLQEVANIIQGYAQYLNPAYDAPPAARKERE